MRIIWCKPFCSEQKQHIKFPKTVDDLKSLGIVISEYQDNYYWEILLFMGTTYILYPFWVGILRSVSLLFRRLCSCIRYPEERSCIHSLQSFMIPGSIFLSVLLGYLFPFPVALGLVALCSAVGASLCYLLIGFVGSKVLLFLIPEKIEYCRSVIHRYRNAMFLCICFLRISPLIPNWLINVSSPIIEVPLLHFFWGTFIGEFMETMEDSVSLCHTISPSNH
ncbi:uncharacterized protein DEA37_0014151 [Paragonimus westermani]|uniref:VTT domain-containing protein n=1 Tax=Paragonimus westermani TaxID=34504 RepID=A0A5J4NKN4_9TREM|nr:uncharacterized protein DEA37_0014151 [Paragonimus westermani]